MAFMKRNLNFGLLFLLIVTLICLLVFSIYYNEVFYKVNSNYKSKAEQANNLISSLTQERQNLNQTSVELAAKSEREQSLSTQYNVLLQERNAFETQLEDTIKSLNANKAELSATKTNLQSVTAQLSQANLKITNREATIANLQSDKSDLENDIDTLCTALDNDHALCTSS